MLGIAPVEQIESATNSASVTRPEIGLQPPTSGRAGVVDLKTLGGLLALIVIWAVKFHTTWAAWGSLTIDSGHEMYVPAMLADGRKLYRDLWFQFGPVAPYFNSLLFRLLGKKLEVLYWAGSLSALGSAIFLYLAGARLGSRVIGWGAGAVILLEAFQPSLFCFPLPYAFSAVYGCLVGCLFVWLLVKSSFSASWLLTLSAGIAAALALLIKPEFGIAAYASLALLIGARYLVEKSWRKLGVDVAAMIPGIAICAAAIGWMVSIAGAKFITEENIQSWPTSYFMRTFGKSWLERNGFTVSGPAFLDAFYRSVPVLSVVLAACVFLRWRRNDARSILIRVLIVLALALYFVKHNYFLLAFKEDVLELFSTIFFPREMVLYVILAAGAAWLYFWLKPSIGNRLAFPLLCTFSGLVAFRVLMKMNTTNYPIYYNGPVVMCYLLLLALVIPRKDGSRRLALWVELALVIGCLYPVFMRVRRIEANSRDYVRFSTDRGLIRVPRHLAVEYRSAIQFMKEESARGGIVLSVPEDTSLYFLSGTICPTRAYLFIPGLVAPGKMTEEAISEIDRAPVEYVLWSNRTFPEYGAKEFGKDFDVEIGDYLKTHFHSLGPLVQEKQPISSMSTGKLWTAVVWERNKAAVSEEGRTRIR